MKIRWILGSLIGILIMGGTATAQITPLLVHYDGDLWAWSPDGMPEQRTQWGYNGGPFPSPDGTQVAYVSWSAEAVAAMEAGPGFAGSMPSNVYVMDVATGAAIIVADQPADGTLVHRSWPSWSPDGTQLAWSEMSGDFSPNAKLMVHDLITGTTRSITNGYSMGYQDGGLWMPPVQWGRGGIARLLYTFGDGSNAMQVIVEVYDPNTGAVVSYNMGSPGMEGPPVREMFWVNHSGLARLAVADGLGNWQVMDPATGALEALQTPPSLRLVGRDDFSVTPYPRFSQGLEWEWQVQSGQSIYALGYTSYGIAWGNTPAIAPGGGLVAFSTTEAVTVWNSGDQSATTLFTFSQAPNPGPIGVAWAATEWVTGAAVVQPPGTTCTLASRLALGQTAAVAPGAPNNVRAEPDRNAALVASLPAGSQMFVENGPVCAGGIQWYQVSWTGGRGWTAEGADGVYWLDSVGADACTNSPATRLQPNILAVVLPGDPNALRDGPGTGAASNVIGRIPANDPFEITGPSVCGNDGRRWWPVRYRNEVGWTAEGDGRTYWLAPAG